MQPLGFPYVFLKVVPCFSRSCRDSRSLEFLINVFKSCLTTLILRAWLPEARWSGFGCSSWMGFTDDWMELMGLTENGTHSVYLPHYRKGLPSITALELPHPDSRNKGLPFTQRKSFYTHPFYTLSTYVMHEERTQSEHFNKGLVIVCTTARRWEKIGRKMSQHKDNLACSCFWIFIG